MRKLLSLFLLFIFTIFVFCGCEKELTKSSKNLTNYEIAAVLDYNNKTISANEKVSYYNSTGGTLNFICFNLYPNAFRENSNSPTVSVMNKSKCFANGESFGSIKIVSVSNNELSLNYEIVGEDENILKINLPFELANKKRVEININFDLIIPNCNHRFGFNDKTINLGNWYPIACVFENGEFYQKKYNNNGDPFYSDCANYNIKITAPSGLQIAGTGNKKSIIEDENTVWVFTSKAVRECAFVIGDFQSKETKVGKTKITYYYYDDPQCDLSLETAKKSIETFNELFGKYPYSNFNVVQTKFVQGGMEYPELVLISDVYTNKEDYQNIIIHETAHQWWYGVVGNNQFENAWQDEALAEFSTALFYKKHPEYKVDFDKHFTNLKNSYLLFEKVYKDVLKTLNTSMARPINDFKTEPEYTYLTYVKGNLMFKNLYDIIGEEKFINALRIYYKQNKFKTTKPEQLIDCFNKSSKQNLNEFFNNWLLGNVNLNEI